MEGIMIAGLRGLPEIKRGYRLGELIVRATQELGLGIAEGDVIVITHVAVAKAEGRVYPLSAFEPSSRAIEIAEKTGKDPRHVEAILREAREIIRIGNGIIITETRHGLVCANSGVDLSNVGEGMVALLPENPDSSARRIRLEISEETGVDVAVIISDSQGRAFRRGAINVAIGCSGLEPIWDRRGELDMYGRPLVSKQICVADELASAAELVMGQASERVPAALIRGYRYVKGDRGADAIFRPRGEDLFR